MKLVEGLAALDELGRARGAATAGEIEARSAVLVGVFDGVHLGHQRLIHELLELGSSTGSLPTVVTFRNHPDGLLRGKDAEWIVGLEHRLRLLRRAGVQRVVLLEFDEGLRQMTAAEFTERILIRGLAVRGLLLGYDGAIGRNREGTPERMAELGREHGFEVRQGSLFEVDGSPVSSTAIRDAIRGGDLDLANRMLGRWPSALGRVVHGAGRGRTLGFPTANLELHDTVLPPEGVYAVEVLHDGRAFAGVANFGTRPTVDVASTHPHDAPPPLEVHIFDFDEDVYDATLEVAFVTHIRAQRKFADLDALRDQIRADAAVARARQDSVT